MDGAVPGGGVLAGLVNHVVDGIGIVGAVHPVEHHAAHHALHPVGNPGAAHLGVDDPGEQVQILLGVGGLLLLALGFLHGLEDFRGGGVPLEVVGLLQLQAQVLDFQVALLLVDGAHLHGVGAAVLQSALDGGGVVHVGVVARHLDVLGQARGRGGHGKAHRAQNEQSGGKGQCCDTLHSGFSL